MIENQLHTTVIFPDSDIPSPTNGGFQNQDEFRKWVAKHQDGQHTSRLHARPLPERLADYEGENVAQAFPLQFPYGHSGLPKTKAVEALAQRKGNAKHMKRDRLGVLRKYLKHRRIAFHDADFNLVVENLIMKQTVFHSAKLHCNTSKSELETMGEHYGLVTSQQLSDAIDAARRNDSVQHSSKPEHHCLRSINACCKNLPHSNEASKDNRNMYFSYLIRFGLPAMFLTITPDDTRSFRIIAYALSRNGDGLRDGKVQVSELSDDQTLADFKICQDTRAAYPGLCAEEYSRTIHLAVKHLFAWDSERQTSTEMGWFGNADAWCLATEEQGQKTLHGHVLLFIKNWNQILHTLHLREKNDNGRQEPISLSAALKQAKEFYDDSASAQLFSAFDPPLGPLRTHSVFAHDCRSRRKKKKDAKVAVNPVQQQQFRNMQHKTKCHEHSGHIANCPRCFKPFTAQEIIGKALQAHMGTSDGMTEVFPDRSHHLDRIVYEHQKNLSWQDEDSTRQAKRCFATNTLVNFHHATHTHRCFKKGTECYASLPSAPNENTTIHCAAAPNLWCDWKGLATPKWMFRFDPRREVQDAFINTHNPGITQLFNCNNNVLVGMNGCSVFHVTGYNVKSQQREERMAFQKVSEVLVRLLESAVSLGLA